jgi:non-heme chloroperoxidase
MGGGEVARYITRDGQDRLHSVVFAAAVAPYMLQGGDNPEGPLTKQQAAEMTKDQDAFYDQFTAQFFSVDGELQVS